MLRPSNIPKPNPTLKTVPHPKQSIPSTPKHSSLPNSHIPKPLHSSQSVLQPSASSSSPHTCVEQLLQHLNSLNSASLSFPNPCVPQAPKFPPGTWPVPPTPGTPERSVPRALTQLQQSPWHPVMTPVTSLPVVPL